MDETNKEQVKFVQEEQIVDDGSSEATTNVVINEGNEVDETGIPKVSDDAKDGAQVGKSNEGNDIVDQNNLHQQVKEESSDVNAHGRYSKYDDYLKDDSEDEKEVQDTARKEIIEEDDSDDDEDVNDDVAGYISQNAVDNQRVDVNEELVEDQEEEEEEDILPDDFYYDNVEFESKPVTDPKFSNNLLTLYHSFGYECTKASNLHLIDDEHVIFSAGNFVQILNLNTAEQQHIRTTGGGGIGAIAVHPDMEFFAVAERGNEPQINIYHFPSLKLHRILRGGTEEAYAHIDFSPNSGIHLASVGCSPDYTLTIWDWKKEKIVLRTKAFSQDIYNVKFSPENEGHLTTSGCGHIKFWTMAQTFTGLKLKGHLGKFGRTQISDIVSFVELPDGKVLSGTDWGNMLVWDDGLIKVQIGRKGKKLCHAGTIEGFFYDEGELITIGSDGYVRVWDFETIDSAEVSEEGQIFEMEPMYELKVGNDVKLKSMVKAVNPEMVSIWYAQDSAGGIWKLDLSFSHTTKPPEKLFSYHSGEITGMETSPKHHMVATTAKDHTVRIYEYIEKQQLCFSKFNAGGTCLLWLPENVDPLGISMLAGFEDGVVRVLRIAKKHDEGTVQRRLRVVGEVSSTRIVLEQVFKPHNASVTSMAIDNSGDILVTGGADSALFFFAIRETFEPIGFIEMPHPVVSVSWAPESHNKKVVLVCCDEGKVLEVEAPKAGIYSTSKSFKLSDNALKVREFQFCSIKKNLRKAEADAIKKAEEDAKRKAKADARAERGESDSDTESLQADGEEEEKVDEEEQQEEEEAAEAEEEIDPGIPSIIRGFYAEDADHFWLSMDGYDAGYMYKCKLETQQEWKARVQDDTDECQYGEPLKSVPVTNSGDTPVRCLHLSDDGKLLLLGLDNGIVRCQPLDTPLTGNKLPYDIPELEEFWSLAVHDCFYGRVTNLHASYDKQYIITTSSDGNIFAFKFDENAIDHHKDTVPIALAVTEDEDRMEDITERSAYSLEDAKQKSEYDKRLKEAEEKKQNVRREMSNLRSQFKKILNRNADLPLRLQLKKYEFEIDQLVKGDIAEQKVKKIDLVKKQLAWESEKNDIALKKLKSKFKDNIEFERIVVKGFQAGYNVTTYRLASTSTTSEDFKDGLHRAITTAEGDGTNESTTRERTKSQTTSSKRKLKSRATPTSLRSEQRSFGKKSMSNLSKLPKAEQRKRKRLLRQKEWEDLDRSKPSEEYEDQELAEAIKYAHENMGDFKLKTAKDYVVPEDQRLTANKKRDELIKLRDQIYRNKRKFNLKVLALRQKKREVITDVEQKLKLLRTIQAQLGPNKSVPLMEPPTLDIEEEPERRFNHTEESLIKFKEDMKEKERQQLVAAASEEGGLFSGFLNAFPGGSEQQQQASTQPSANETPQNKDSQARSTALSFSSDLKASRTSSRASQLDNQDAHERLLSMDNVGSKSSLEEEMDAMKEIRLSYQRDSLLEEVQALLSEFDEELAEMREEKANLDIKLKNSDLKYLTLFEELALLKEFEMSENVLADRVDARMEEKADMQAKVEDCLMKLEAKKRDIERLQDREKNLNQTFHGSLGDSNKFVEFLTKLYKKKIKKVKKKTKDSADSDEESDEDDDDDDYLSSDTEDDDSEDEIDYNVCPAGCDQDIFQDTMSLRERRQENEEQLAEEKKACDMLKKEHDNLTKKLKAIDAGLKTAQGELEKFQLEKQQKLNELDVVVTLNLDQIQYIVNGTLPRDLAQCLVFRKTSQNQLQERIEELKVEKMDQRRLFKEDRQKYAQLLKDKKVLEAKIKDLEDKVKEMQLLKFGRIVDLEKLENVTVNKGADELKDKLRQTEFEYDQELANWDKSIEETKKNLNTTMQDNTALLDKLMGIVQEDKELETNLNSCQKGLGANYHSLHKADKHERWRLQQLIKLQSQEINALKSEIDLLSRKGGHIVPPAYAPQLPKSQPLPAIDQK